MKRILLVFGMACVLQMTAFAQAKKPTIMVVPSDKWCIDNGYYTTYNDYGTSKTLPDYYKAMQGDANLLSVISKINELMIDRGFPLKNLESVLKSIQNDEAELAVISSKNGASIEESPIDKLKRVAKADIIMQITWTINKIGPKKSVTFILQGLDSYTDKQIAGSSGTGTASFTSELTVLLEEAVVAHLDNFNVQLQNHFNDMAANGREVKVTLRKFDNSPIDFETEFEYNGQIAELADIIGVWFELNCVEGRFNADQRSSTTLSFDQVRMPLYGKSLSGKEVAIDATSWVRTLTSMLAKEPYNVPCKTMLKGLGEVMIIMGDK